MKKILLLTSGWLFTLTSTFAAANDSKMIFTINNQTHQTIKNLYAFPASSNLSPTKLTETELPTGNTVLTFTILNSEKIAGIALAAGSNSAINISGTYTPAALANHKKTTDSQCYSHNPIYSVTCTNKSIHGVYHVDATISTN
ncbi:MAG: hypothetical protein A3E82_06255 [Gammaproteobacteria bacterium RIFCSPHIGHO2_12_FULL_38_11]|nr:MAG: hypothetical protein A3E82_06255 [Gammaproteobacteria bacterium RIFCSPHIGHO2_12_FULL_38_11]